MPLCFSDCIPQAAINTPLAGTVQQSFLHSLNMRTLPLAVREMEAARTENMESRTTGTDFAYLEEGK
jgi:hypothetical protein